eukprot:gene14005-19938_t
MGQSGGGISKCTFAQPKTVFLGFQVSSDGLSVDPKKIAAVADWSLPHDSQSTRSFLGFTGFYRRFIKDYAKIAAPLTELTKTSKPFPHPLPQPAVDAFHILKAALIQAPLLVIPFTGTPATFELYTDASGLGVGAVLLQDQGKGPQPVIISDPIQHDIALGYSDDPLYAQPENPKRPSFLEKHNDLWYFKGRLCVPNIPELRLRILHEYHDVPSAGHPGFHKTLNAVADKFWWPPSPAALIVTSDVPSEAADYMSHLKDVQAVGDQVRLSSDFISLYDQPSAKLRHRFLGPFTVLECIPTTDPTAYKLDLPSSMSRVHPVFHVSRLLPWTPNNEDEFPGRHIPNRPIPAAKDYVYGDAYEVDRILDVKIAQDPASRARPKADNIFFLVKWAPPYQDPSEDTWEPYRNLKSLDAMNVFLRSPEYHTFTLTPAFLSFACKHKAKIPKVVRFDIP